MMDKTPTSLLNRYKSSSQKSQKQMPKKKQSTQTELFAYVKTAKHRFQKVPIPHGEQQKKWQKNLKLVFHLSVSLTTIHVVKLIPCLSSTKR